jgi:signal transduction histidine kinase
MPLALRRLVDRWIPAELARDPDQSRRARLIVSFSALLGSTELLFVPYQVVTGQVVSGLVTLLMACCITLPVPLLWATRGLVLPSALTCSVMFAGNLYFSLVYGGIEGSAMFSYAVLPVLSLLLAGRRSALVWLAAVTATAGLFGGAALMGHTLESASSAQENILGNMLFLPILGLSLLGIGWMFESAKERMRLELVARHQDLQLVLDNVGQGFVCADLSGRVVGECSAVTKRWFGLPMGQMWLWDWLGQRDPSFRTWAALGWGALAEDVLPLELVLDQLPRRLTDGHRTWRVEYRPVLSGTQLHRVVLVVSDITEAVAVEAAEAEQREVLAALQHAQQDRTGFLSFLEEADGLVQRLLAGDGHTQRQLHTLKGMCAMFGADRLSAEVHDLETRLLSGTPPDGGDLQAFGARWRSFLERLAPIVGPRERRIELDDARYREVVAAVERRQAPELLLLVRSLAWEPTRGPLSRAAEYARVLAGRLGKPEPIITLEPHDLLSDPVQLREVWATMVHLVRNAVDHGLEPELHRQRHGKPAAGRLTLRTRLQAGELLLEIEDDGRGIDWDAVGVRAAERGLPASTPQELTDALFADGLSTRADASEVSGRGIGAGAFREAVRACGGEVEVRSEAGRGTLVRARLPGAAARAVERWAERALVSTD